MRILRARTKFFFETGFSVPCRLIYDIGLDKPLDVRWIHPQNKWINILFMDFMTTFVF